MLNAINRAIYIYFGFLTKTTIIGHYTVFHGLIAQVSMEWIHETQCNGQLLLLLLKTQSIYKLLCLRHWALYLRVVTTHILFSILLLQYQSIVEHYRIHSRLTQQSKRWISAIQWKIYHYPLRTVTGRIWFSNWKVS